MSFLDALKQANAAATPKTLRGTANMLAEVISYNEDSLTVKAINGPIEGQEMQVTATNMGTKEEIAKMSKPSKAQTSMHVPEGGVIRLDSVRRVEDGVYKAGWLNSFIKDPSQNELLLDQHLTYVDTGNKNSSGQPIVLLNNLAIDQEAEAESFDHLKELVTAALESHGGASIYVAGPEGLESTQIYVARRKDKDGTYKMEDPTEKVESVFGSLPDEAKQQYEGLIADIGMTVVPSRSMFLGGVTTEETAKAIAKAKSEGRDRARIMSVDPYAYQTPSVGVRVAGALRLTGDRALPEGTGDELKALFLKTASEPARDALMSDGWAAVRDSDMRKFFKAHDAEIPKVPATGWNRAAVCLQNYEGSDDKFVVKTHEARRYASPYPPLNVTKDLREEYNQSVTSAIQKVLADPELDNSAAAEKAETKAAAAGAAAGAAAATEKENPEEAAAKAAEAASTEADIDDLLDSMDSEENEEGMKV